LHEGAGFVGIRENTEQIEIGAAKIDFVGGESRGIGATGAEFREDLFV
jgi:hypothetical protein